MSITLDGMTYEEPPDDYNWLAECTLCGLAAGCHLVKIEGPQISLCWHCIANIRENAAIRQALRTPHAERA